MAFIKDEEKQLLLDRYEDIEWCDDVTHVQCVHCHRVAINHFVSNCKHIFCNDCKTELSDKKRKKCPQCHEHVTQMDFDVEVKIHQLKIFCPNKKYGCKYEDRLRKIPIHLMTCVDTGGKAHPRQSIRTNDMDAVLQQITDVKASVGVLKKGLRAVKKKDDENLKKQELKDDEMDKKLTEKMSSVENQVEAINLISQKYAEDLGSLRSLLELMNQRIQQNESHVQLTSSDVVEMRTMMSSMTQEMKTHHDNVNEQKRQMDEVNSKFIGLKSAQHELTETIARMEMTAEEEFELTKSTLESVNQRLQHNESLLKQTTANAEELASEIKQQACKDTGESNASRAETYEWTIQDVNKNLEEENRSSESDVFKVIGYEYDIKGKILRDGKSVFMFLQFKNEGTINRQLSKKGFTTVNYTIRDQYNIQNQKDVIQEKHLRFTEWFFYPDWIFKCRIPDAILSPVCIYCVTCITVL